MSKENNLKDFLTDVADAIREKKGMTDLISPLDFSEEILGIETGGKKVPMNDVVFYDYDGTILYSYSKDEFLALNEMPKLPTTEGLICQGWTHNISESKEYVSKYDILDVGATYITDDGDTRLYVTICEKYDNTLPLYITQTITNGVTIDWGDGSAAQTISGTGSVNTTHTYTNTGDYCVRLKPSSGCILGLGDDSSVNITGNATYYNNSNKIRKVEIGRNVTRMNANAFNSCFCIDSITIPEGVTSIGRIAIYNSNNIRAIIIPKSVLTIEGDSIYSCHGLKCVVIPSSITSAEVSNFLRSCKSMTRIVIPDIATKWSNLMRESNCSSSLVVPSNAKIGDYCFYYCYPLTSIKLSEGVTEIGSGAFFGCRSLSYVKFPKTITNIGYDAFYGCDGMIAYDFTDHTSIPTLGGSGALGGNTKMKIIVPDALYSSWCNATNWSGKSYYITRKSSWDASHP